MNEPTALPTLVVEIEGSVRKSTVEEFRAAAMEYVGTISTDLQTDEDFADAEDVAKWCKNAEKKIKTVKEQAMTQAADINAAFSLLDEVSAALRDKRVSLDRQVKALKQIRKQESIGSSACVLARGPSMGMRL